MSSLMKLAATSVINIDPKAGEKIQGVILDCDGVLFDSKEANTAYYNHIRLAVQLPPLSEDEAAYSHMASVDEVIERLIPEDLRDDAVKARNSVQYRDTFMSMMQPAPHVFQFLRAMKAKGMPMALCTNRSDSVHHVLRHFGMDEFFSPVMTISHAPPKPSPQGLIEITKMWDSAPGSLIFIGDSLVDQQAAVGAGISFWSFNSPELSAPIHISGFKELEDIMHLMLMR